MKAIVCEKYGPPEVLQIKDVEKPIPGNDEVLIKIHATTVAPSDGMMRSGHPLWGRLILGLARPARKYRILGTELAGEVEAVGKDVRRFKAGDQVYGFRGFGTGTCAEYKTMPEKGSLCLKPANLSYEEAAAVVDGATTALFFLRDKGNIQRGQKVLINGASGSIGTYAVQLARYFGANVTGTCSTRNIELVKSLGADRVIDYTKEDFTRNGDTYDIIFDAVGKSSFSRCKNALKENGLYLVTTGPILKIYFQSLWTSLFGRKKLIYAMSVEKNDALVFIKELVEVGALKPIIDRTYLPEQIAEAHRYVESGRKKGNIVIPIAGNM